MPGQGPVPDPNQPSSGWSGAVPVTSGTSSSGTSSSGSSAPSWLWPALCLVLAVVAVGAVLVALNNSQSGNRWKTQATSASALAQKLDTELATSEAASKKLEVRTVTLAAEKADANDKLAVRSVLPTDVAATADLLDKCSSGTRNLLNAVADAQSQAELDSLSNQANQVFQVCGNAQGAASQLANYLRDQAKAKK
jgi:hypothetical protein